MSVCLIAFCLQAVVLDLAENGQTGDVLKIKYLSPTERSALHSYSELNGLSSRSEVS